MRRHLAIPIGVLVIAILLSPLDFWFQRWLFRADLRGDSILYDGLWFLIYLWPLVVIVAWLTIGRQLWRTGGRPGRIGAGILASALAIALASTITTFLIGRAIADAALGASLTEY